MSTSITSFVNTSTVIFDIDGTLADCTHRQHHIHPVQIEGQPRARKNWHAFFTACVDDKPITDVIEVLHLYHSVGYSIILVSGRSDIVRIQTEQWLENWNIPYDHLLMRKQGDYRPDDIIKEEILHRDILHHFSPICAVYDDRDRVVSMWRRNGLRCFQVAPGNF